MDAIGPWSVFPGFSKRVPIAFARRMTSIALMDSHGIVWIAISHESKVENADVLSRFLGYPTRWRVFDETQIVHWIDEAYQERDGTVQQLISMVHDDGSTEGLVVGDEDLLETTGRPPIIRLVNEVVLDAIQSGASDIHFQPYEDQLVVRLRIDGVLFDLHQVPKTAQEEVLSRIKVLGKMNIAEKRLPQDGRASVHLGARQIDLRIASMPTAYGERIVIRLLDKSARLYRLAEIGMEGATLDKFRQLIRLEHGMILVTGPTGSGKSTTLYAALSEINSKVHNAVTLEDPIEYQLEGISQTQINTKKGMTFASGLRSVLRQDPDIIMVGEIRDDETAAMAVQSALTGHLVFSTLHTNDAASAIARLIDLGIEPYLAASSLVAIMAQRLVRRVCPACAVPHELTDLEWNNLGLPDDWRSRCNAKIGVGCDKCRGSGYRGRIGIYELLVVSEAVRELIQRRTRSSEIRDQAVSEGMLLLRDSGMRKIYDGQTTIEEVARVTMRTEL
jgi:general secretion pathway protein E